jgi:hypothetical protein
MPSNRLAPDRGDIEFKPRRGLSWRTCCERKNGEREHDFPVDICHTGYYARKWRLTANPLGPSLAWKASSVKLC